MTPRRRAWRKPVRVVLDTNVIVSALVFGTGAPAQLRRLWQSAACTPLVSTPMAQELMRVLAYPKFKLEVHEREELLADYLPCAEVVRIPEPPPVVPTCRDPFDLPFLQAASVGRADALVSGDADLLALAGQTAFAILMPSAFIQLLTEAVEP